MELEIGHALLQPCVHNCCVNVHVHRSYTFQNGRRRDGLHAPNYFLAVSVQCWNWAKLRNTCSSDIWLTQ